MENLEWYEYNEAEMQIAVLQGKINAAREDVENFPLSDFSRNAIMNEVQRHSHFIDDIKEEMGEDNTPTEPIRIVEAD